MMLSARQISRAFDRAMRGTLGSYSSDGTFAQKVAERLGADAAFVRRVAEEIRNQSDLGERASLALEVELRQLAGDAPPIEEGIAEPASVGADPDPVTPAPLPPGPLSTAGVNTLVAPAYPNMPAPDDMQFLVDQAEARQHLRHGWRAKQIADYFGWDLEWCQEWCAAEGRKA